MKLGKLNGNGTYYISLPKALVKAKGWNYGDQLIIKINKKGNLEIERFK